MLFQMMFNVFQDNYSRNRVVDRVHLAESAITLQSSERITVITCGLFSYFLCLFLIYVSNLAGHLKTIKDPFYSRFPENIKKHIHRIIGNIQYEQQCGQMVLSLHSVHLILLPAA